jgi:dipeptidase D
MALLESNDIPHPPLTVILTTNEEVGLLGAAALSAEHLEGKYMINLDSGGDGLFTAGCAGGLRTVLTIPCTREVLPAGFSSVKINVKGLLGGHSGGNIKLERGNANKLIGRILSVLNESFDVRINTISGGDKENAIPREAEAVVCIKTSDLASAKKTIDTLAADIKTEYATSDPNIIISHEDIFIGSCFNVSSSKKIIITLNILPCGLQHMDQNLPAVETSVSVGVVRTENDSVKIFSAIRSSVASRKYEVRGRIRDIAAVAGAEYEAGSEYTGWAFKKDSHLHAVCAETYKELYEADAKFLMVHGGLECGLFLEKAPGLDIVAMGPNAYDFHSPDERLEIKSFARCWELLKAVLAKLDK